MKHFISYFDYLGFREFLLNNSEAELERRSYHLLGEIERSLSETYKQKHPGYIVPDLSESNINCLNISDTVLFWTKDDSLESCKELLEVSFRFNWQNNLFQFPVRGCMIYDDFNIISGKSENSKGSVYLPNLMYGKGLLNAHNKTEQMNWAGSVIDNSVIEKVQTLGEYNSFFSEFAKEYKVPYKGYYKKEFAFFMRDKEIKPENFKTLEENIIRVFELDNKRITPSVEEKMNNTLEFIRSGMI